MSAPANRSYITHRSTRASDGESVGGSSTLVGGTSSEVLEDARYVVSYSFRIEIVRSRTHHRSTISDHDSVVPETIFDESEDEASHAEPSTTSQSSLSHTRMIEYVLTMDRATGPPGLSVDYIAGMED